MSEATASLFLHTSTGAPYPTADPVAWCLENARSRLLEPARERLLLCVGRTDGERIVNVVVRRCALNLVELRPGRVTVHYWTKLADLHAFLKARGLLRPDVQVALVRRKTGQVTLATGDDYIRGERLGDGFPLAEYRAKWERRHEREAGDWAPAAASYGSYSWEDVEEKRIPWGVLKAVWRAESVPCPNCDAPQIVRRFDWRRCGMFSAKAAVERVCPGCARRFEERLERDPWPWIVARLAPDLLPVTWDGGFGRRNLRPRWPTNEPPPEPPPTATKTSEPKGGADGNRT